MSTSTTIDVHCDGCGTWVEGVGHGVAGKYAVTPGGARAEARECGWTCSRSGDWCPTCAQARTPAAKTNTPRAKRQGNLIEWSESGEWSTCGKWMINREEVRGEGVWYWIDRMPFGADEASGIHNIETCSHGPGALPRMRKAAERLAQLMEEES